MDEAVVKIMLQEQGKAPSTTADTSAAKPSDPKLTADVLNAQIEVQDRARSIIQGAQKDLEKFQKEQDEYRDEQLEAAKKNMMASLDAQVEIQDYAREILEGAEEHLRDFQKEQEDAANAAADVLIGMQDYAREILAGAQEDLEKFQKEQEEKKSGGITDIFKSISDAIKKGLGGDFGGMIKGITGEGGAMEKMGISTEAVASVVPVVGAVLAAKQVADMVNQMAIDSIKSGIGTAGSVATSIASVNEDVTVPMAQLGDATSKAGEKLTYLSPMLGYFTVAVGESGKALASLMQAVDQTAKHYEDYSVDIAMASARAEIRQTMGNLRRGQSLGAGLGSYIEAKSKLENHVEDIKTTILERMLPLITMMVKAADTTLTLGEKAWDMQIDAAKAIIQTRPELLGLIKIQNMILGEIRDSAEEKKDEIEDPITVLLKDNGMAEPFEPPTL